MIALNFFVRALNFMIGYDVLLIVEEFDVLEDGRVPFDMKSLALISKSLDVSEGHVGVKFFGVDPFDRGINVPG